jgi:hypothetical protein
VTKIGELGTTLAMTSNRVRQWQESLFITRVKIIESLFQVLEYSGY